MYKKSIHLTLITVLGLILTNTVNAELVGWWKFDDNAGTVAIDSSGYDHDGIITNATWEAGRYGSALSFDGTAYVDVSPEAWASIETQVTVAFWVYADETPPNNFIFGAYIDPAINIARIASAHVPWAGNTIYWDTSGNVDTWDPDRINKEINFEEYLGAWHHWTFLKNAETGWQEIYIDGVLWHGVDGMTKLVKGTEVTKFTIGTKPSLAEGWFIGMIDDFRLFDHALTENEILAVLEGAGADYPYALGPNPADGTLHEDTWITLDWRPGDFAVSHDVYLGEDYHDIDEATRDSDAFMGNQTATFFVAGFPGFAYPDGLVPGTTYYWRIDEVNEADPSSPWKGKIWSFSIPPKTAYNPDPANGAEITDPNSVMLSWTPGFGAKLHTVFFGDDFDEVNNVTTGIPTGSATYSPGKLEKEMIYYWRVDEFDAMATHKGDIWTFTTPGAVGNPQPANNVADVGMNANLTWTAADSAASHQLYLGTDKVAVRNAGTASPEYKGSVALGTESYDPGLLEANTMYYWRVDKVDAQGNAQKGPIWIFTTGAFLLIDDYESYTDDDVAGEAIWQTWIDGFGIADNGAQVGYLMPPYAEQTIVHSGSQSMPLMYVNEAGVLNSEALLTLTASRDWTIAGVEELSLWHRGESANAVDPLYVAISNAAGAPGIVAHDDPDAATKTPWKQWRISLQAFADQGINLTNVDKIAIGLGSKSGMAPAGGSGTVYIDDIRLYQP